MSKAAKRIAKNEDGLDRSKFYGLADAVKLVKAKANAKFDETIEISMNLGVDPRHADQMVRGLVNLPNPLTGQPLTPDACQALESCWAASNTKTSS